jgi:hypothetical protein
MDQLFVADCTLEVFGQVLQPERVHGVDPLGCLLPLLILAFVLARRVIAVDALHAGVL